MPDKTRVVDSKANKVFTLPLTSNIQIGYSNETMSKGKTKSKIMPKIAIVPTAEEMEIVNAGRKKHGLKSASEILRMALRRFAEAEGLKAS
ncbi:MAG TPA: hypothetical protein VHV32_19165 [Candidatus Angelobacter sp.]|nr:hypothetical protein [Candidatus Angelobacter sp.]